MSFGRSKTVRRLIALTARARRSPIALGRRLQPKGLGMDYDTTWARRRWAQLIREVMIQSITRPTVNILATPKVIGRDRLDHLNEPVIFVANHSSHLDTSVLLVAVPARFRRRLAVTAGADYPLFFKTRRRSALWALWMNVIPIDRYKISRRSIQFAQSVMKDGWNLLIYPEGTRGIDDFVIEFKPGAAYLAIKSGVPLVPVYIEGTRRIFTPYKRRIRPGRTKVTFGEPITALDDEKPAQLNERLELAVAAAADECHSDWWSARQRAARGTTPSLKAPAGLDGWRRSWASSSPRAKRSLPSWPLA